MPTNRINQYEYDPDKDFLGGGAFADVFKAKDVNAENTYVALKIYKEAISKGSNASSTLSKYDLEREFQNTQGLSHENIVSFKSLQYFDTVDYLGRKSRFPVIVMEYASEGNLTQFVAKNQPSDALKNELFLQVVKGVSYLHRQGVIHRDLKPGNIVVTKDRNGDFVAKITDFGISKDTVTGKTIEQSYTEGVGTPHYMAPEQFYAKRFGIDGKIDHRSDIWSLGVLLHWFIQGNLPFASGKKGYEEIREAITQSPLNLDSFKGTEQQKKVVIGCLQKEAGKRFKHALELEKVLNGEMDSDATRIYPVTKASSGGGTQIAGGTGTMVNPTPGVSKKTGNWRYLLWLIPVFLAVGIASKFYFDYLEDEYANYYNKAERAYENENYREAVSMYEKALEYRDKSAGREKLLIAKTDLEIFRAVDSKNVPGLKDALRLTDYDNPKWLVEAIKESCIPCAKVLAEESTNIKREIRVEIDSNITYNYFSLAASLGRLSITRDLHQNHFKKVDYKTGKIGEWTPLQEALNGGFPKTSTYLIEEGASLVDAWDYANNDYVKAVLRKHNADRITTYSFNYFDPLSDSYRKWEKVNGKMKFSVVSGSYSHPLDFEKKDLDIKYTDKDFEIKADIRLVSGATNGGYGLMFAKKDGDNFSVFWVSPDGEYAIKEMRYGNWIDVQDWTTHSSINRGYGTNRLRVKNWKSSSGVTHYDFYINGSNVKWIPHSRFKAFGNGAGLSISSSVLKEVEFSNFYLRAYRK